MQEAVIQNPVNTPPNISPEQSMHTDASHPVTATQEITTTPIHTTEAHIIEPNATNNVPQPNPSLDGVQDQPIKPTTDQPDIGTNKPLITPIEGPAPPEKKHENLIEIPITQLNSDKTATLPEHPEDGKINETANTQIHTEISNTSSEKSKDADANNINPPLETKPNDNSQNPEEQKEAKPAQSYDEMPIKPKSFEDIPVGKGGNIGIPEFPPEEKPVEEEKGPLESRLVSKTWNTRAKAFEELAKLLATDPSSLEAYSKKWPKFIADPMAASQEKAIDSLKVFIEKYEAFDATLIESITAALIEKGLTSVKTNTKTKSTDCLLLLVETTSQFEPVTKVSIEMLTKAAKIQVAAAQFVATYISNFGIAHIEIKGYLKCFEKLAGSTNAALRNEAMNFYKEVYRWIRDALLPLISGLKQAQQDELKVMFEAITEAPTPLRLSKKDKCEGKKAEAFQGGKSSKQSAKIDPFDLQEASDTLSKYNEAWCDKFTKLKTWKEKKEALDDVLKSASIPKIKCPAPQCLIITAEKIIDKESNIVVISTAIKSITAMATGLRKLFTGWKGLFPRLIYKCKEKKLEAEIMKCLEEMRWAIKLPDLIDDIKELTISEKAKTVNPISKKCLSDWLNSFVKEFAADQESANSLAKMMMALSDDSSNEVRDSSLATLGVLKAKCSIDSILKDLNTQKKEKIEKSYNSCNGNAEKPGEGDHAKPKQAKVDKNADLKTSKVKEESKPQAIEHKKEEKKKSSKKSEKADEPQEEEEADNGDIEKVVTSKVDASIITLLNSSAWKEKKEGFAQLSEKINNDKEGYNAIQDSLVKYTKKLLKGWKESNLNILKEAFTFCTNLINCGCVNKKAAFHLLGFYIEKIGDPKFNTCCDESILKITESTGPTFVCNRILKLSDAYKAFPIIKGILGSMTHLISEFPIKLFPLKPMIEYAKVGLSSNPSVKAASTELLKTVYSFLGEPMKTFISDLKEPQLKPLETELSKVTIVKEKSHSRKLVGEAVEEESKSSTNALDSLIPRADISSQVTPKLIKAMSDGQWKARNSALNDIKAIITKANNRILPNGLNELCKDIGLRIKDSHKGVQRGFIQLISLLAESMGPKVRQYSKFILPNLIDTLSDKQQLLRADSLASISKFAEIAGPDIVVNQMAPPLCKDSPEMRSEILKWMLKDKSCFKNCDQKLMLPAVIASLQDKSKDTRGMAEQLIPMLMPYVGMSSFGVAMQDLKPAVKNTLKPIIEKYGDSDVVPQSTETDSSTPQISVESTPAKEEQSTASKGEKIKTRNDNKATAQTVDINTLPKEPNDPRPKTSMANKGSANKLNSQLPKQDSLKNIKEMKGQITRKSSNNKALGKMPPSPSNPKLLESSNRVISASTTEINKMVPFVLISSKDKDKRAEFDRKHPWPSDEIRDDYVEWMKKALKPILNPNAFNAMFTVSNFKKHTDCVISLKIALKSEINEIIEILDLILKWICCRLIDNNPGLNKAIIELLSDLIVSLEGVSYTLYDSEAAILMPLLTERTGNSNQFLKDSCKELIRKMTKILAPQKVVNYLVRALKCKNLKARVECLEIIKQFISAEQSMEYVTDKNLNFIALNIVTKDNILKNSIIQLLTVAFQILGGDCWKHLGKLEEQVQNEIREKVQNSAQPEIPEFTRSDSKGQPNNEENNDITNAISNEASTRTEDNAQIIEKPHHSPEPAIINSSPHPPAEVVGSYISKSITPLTTKPEPPMNLTRSNIAEKKEQLEEHSPPQFTQSQITPGNTKAETNMYVVHKENVEVNTGESVLHPEMSIERLIENIEKGSCNTLEDLLVLNEIMYMKYEKNEQSIIANANRMVKVFISYFQKIVINESTIGENKLSYLINTIHRFASFKSVAKELNLEALSSLIELLLSKLIIEGLDKMGPKKEGDQIVKTINASVLRLLDNANSTLTFIALIKMIGKYRDSEGCSKMHNLVVKCLLKLSHVMSYIIYNVDMGKVLIEMHEFLITHPASTSEDMDSKVLKTVINEVVAIKKDKIWEDYEVVKLHKTPDITIIKWIESRLKEILPSSVGIDNELKEIIKSFKVHGIKSSIGKMYDYIHKNPTFDLNKSFSNCSRTFINHLTAELEEERARREKEKEAENPKAKPTTKCPPVKLANLQHTLGQLREKLNGPKKVVETLNPVRSKADKTHDIKDSQDRLKDLSDQIKKLKMGEWNNN